MTGRRRYDVALSFAGANRPYVAEVARFLRESGARVFYDAFEQGKLFGEELVTYLQKVFRDESRYVVIFSSKQYAENAWARRECRAALERALENNGAYVLPVRLDSTQLPGLDGTVGYLDGSILTPFQVAKVIGEKLGRPMTLSSEALADQETERAAISYLMTFLAAMERALDEVIALLADERLVYYGDDRTVVNLVDRNLRTLVRMYETMWTVVPDSLSTGPEVRGDAADIFNERLPKSFTVARAIQPIRYRTMKCLDEMSGGGFRMTALDSSAILADARDIKSLVPRAKLILRNVWA
jgi:hypothetical protein